MLEEVHLIPDIKVCVKCKRRFIERENEDKSSIKASRCNLCNEQSWLNWCICFFRQ